VPELPEVEVVRRGLAKWVTGRTVDHVAVAHPRAVRRHIAGPVDFAARLTGQRMGPARRRGKYLWLTLDGDEDNDSAQEGDHALVAHLGMSGQLLLRPTRAPDEVHLRVTLSFSDGGPQLRFVDQRTFGGLAVEPLTSSRVPQALAHIARDPLDPLFDDHAFASALRRRRTGLKRALLDQTLISGVGNIYADESLWRARQHYARATSAMTTRATADLLGHVRAVMTEALAQGGTSFDSLYVNVNGESGYFERSLDAYGQQGRPCPRCGTPIRREAFMNRSSFLCPRCQPRPRAAHW